MNKVILIGRLTRDPEVKTTQSQLAVCTFTVACDRRFKDANGERQADFITCVAWRQNAELLGKYFQKGSRIGIVGNIQVRSYEVDGNRRYSTEVMVDEIEFVDSKKDSQNSGGGGYSSGAYAAPSAPPLSPAPSSFSPATPPPPAPAGDNGFFVTMDDDTMLPFDL